MTFTFRGKGKTIFLQCEAQQQVALGALDGSVSIDAVPELTLLTIHWPVIDFSKLTSSGRRFLDLFLELRIPQQMAFLVF